MHKEVLCHPREISFDNEPEMGSEAGRAKALTYFPLVQIFSAAGIGFFFSNILTSSA